MARKKITLFEDPETYDQKQMFCELNQLLDVCFKLGQVQVAMQVILAKGRISGAWDALSDVYRAKSLQNNGNGQLVVQIQDFKGENVNGYDIGKSNGEKTTGDESCSEERHQPNGSNS